MEQYHFIGKDIVYFHTLFWPAMLRFSERKTPTNVFVHGFITALLARRCPSRAEPASARSATSNSGMNPEWLRYYIAAKLNDRVEDIDFNPDDFIARVNSDLVGKYVNIASRAASFIAKHFDGKLALSADDARAVAEGADDSLLLAAGHYNGRQYGQVVRDAMAAADRINEAFDQAKPWATGQGPGAPCGAARDLLPGAVRVQAADGPAVADHSRDGVGRRAEILRARSRLRLE